MLSVIATSRSADKSVLKVQEEGVKVLSMDEIRSALVRVSIEVYEYKQRAVL